MRTISAPVISPDVADEDQHRRVPFTVIDEAVHLLDSPAEPWGIQFELGFEGRLDGDRLARAVHHALARHPMARARQLPARHSDRTWQWEIPDAVDVEPLRTFEWVDDGALSAARAEFYSVPVPVVESPPLRLRLARGPLHDVLMLNANHAAFDGFGCLRLLESVARAYTDADDPPPPVPLEEARDVLGLLRTGDRAVLRKRARMLADKASDLARRPTPPAADGGRDVPGYGFCHVVLDEAFTKALDEHPGGATVNELLLAALHLCIDAWNRDHGQTSGRIGVLVPVNLRPKEWRKDIVTNMVVDARVSTAPSERSNPAVALDAVRRQSDRIKEGGGAAPVEALRGSSRLPLWMKEPLSPVLWITGNRLVDSAVLSNMGDLDDPPSFGPDAGGIGQAWFSAPCRMPCAVSLGAITVAKRLHLAFRYRHPAFGQTAVRRFAETFVAELEQVAGGSSRGT